VQDEPEHAWRYRAKCKDIDTNYKDEYGDTQDIFYPPRDRKKYKPVADRAKAICWGTGENDPECPVRKECLLYAVEMDDTHGIFGGMSHRERAHLTRKFKRLRIRNKTFREWVMENDGGQKAKQFLGQVPRHQEGPYTPDW
jgi:hypothetical protein